MTTHDIEQAPRSRGNHRAPQSAPGPRPVATIAGRLSRRELRQEVLALLG